MLKVYQYANCDSCRKALKFLQSVSVPFEAIPIRETAPSVGELKLALKTMEDIGKLFNRSGQDYRALNLKDKLPSMKESEIFDLLHKNGNLVKRPFLVGKDFALAGFDEASWKERLKKLNKGQAFEHATDFTGLNASSKDAMKIIEHHLSRKNG